jgi:hypothetical protein
LEALNVLVQRLLGVLQEDALAAPILKGSGGASVNIFSYMITCLRLSKYDAN